MIGAHDVEKGRGVSPRNVQRLLRISVLAASAAALALTGPSSAQINTPRPCTPVVIPDQLASEVDDLVVPAEVCPGQRLKIENEESRKKVEESGEKLRERESETEVRRPAVPGGTAPAEGVEVEDLAKMGFDTKVEESRKVYETPTSRFEEREEETMVKGDGFRYESEESRIESEEPVLESDEW